MPGFLYSTIDPQGNEDFGISPFDSREAAERHFAAKNLELSRLDQLDAMEPKADRVFTRSDLERRCAGLLIGKAKIEQSLQQLAALLEGGVPILNAMRVVADQAPKLLGRAFRSVSEKLLEGGRLADILAREMPFLGREAIGMIAAGEANGDIERMCRYAAELMQKRRKIKGDILQAMAYPAMVIIVATGVVIFLIKSVIPKIMKFLSGRSRGLPPITQALIDIVNFLENYGLWIILTPPVLITIFILLRRNSASAPAVDRAVLRIPVMGKAISSSANALWTRTLGILLGSGIGIIDALQFTEGSQTNRYYRRELHLVRQLVMRGHPLSIAVKASGLRRLAPMAESMIVVGENTGQLDEGLNKIADFSEQQLQQRITLLSKMIEPALFVIVGGIVGFVYIAFFLGLMAASSGR